MTNGARLKRARLAAGLSRKEVAEALNCTVSIIGYYERDEREPRPSAIRKLAELFGVSVAELFFTP